VAGRLVARTKSQGYRPPAYWKPLGEVRARLRIPVVANGEIWTIDDLRRCRDETGCQHFMLGRGALADPTLARRLAALGQEIAPQSRQPQQALAKIQKAEIEKWWPIIKAANVRGE